MAADTVESSIRIAGALVGGGLALGGGVELAFSRHWSAKMEYLYIDMGKQPIVAEVDRADLRSGG